MQQTEKENLAILAHQNVEELKKLSVFIAAEFVNDQFYRRILTRSLYAIVETYLFIARQLVLLKMNDDEKVRTSVSFEEVMILKEITFSLDNKGSILSKSTTYNFEAMFRFTVNIYARIHGNPNPDLSSDGYQKFMRMHKRRNEIVHPVLASSLIINDSEIGEVIAGFAWFMAQTLNQNQSRGQV